VDGVVVVEASPWVEDNAWLLDLAAAEPFILAVVGNLEPGSAGFAANLARFAANPRFRGLRQGPKVLDGLGAAAVRSDLGRLVDADLALDLLIRTEHLAKVTPLARAFPGLRLVINHVGCLAIDGGRPDPLWETGMAEAAQCPSVHCKVSALPALTRLTPAPTELAFYLPVLETLWRLFGEDRLLYGSDWPVSARFAPYAVGRRITAEFLAPRGAAAVEKGFWRNAKAVYRWPDRG
jgi:L-fuconolactonase